MSLKLVETPHYHLWTDALHARSLARQARNRWDRGTYVRWTITTAWTVLEMACEDALETTGIGRRFPENLNNDLAKKNFPPLEWGQGVWQKVSVVHKARKQYVHINASQKELFPEVIEAEKAIQHLRDAIKSIYIHVGKTPPAWVEDDEDPGWDGGISSFANAMVTHQGVSADDPNAIKIAYVYKDKEYITEICSPDTDPTPLLEDLIRRLRRPVSAVRAYRGTQLLIDRPLSMRGA